MNKNEAKHFSSLSEVNILQCSFFQHPEPYSLINANAVLFSWASGLQRVDGVSRRTVHLDILMWQPAQENSEIVLANSKDTTNKSAH